MPMTPYTSRIALDLERIVLSTHSYRIIRAGLLTTRDRDHALNVVRETATRLKQQLYHFSVAARRRWNQDKFFYEPCGGSTHDSAELLRGAANLRGGGVVVIEDLLATFADANGDRNARQQLAAMLSDGDKDGTVLLFLEPPEAEAGIPAMFSGAFFRLTIPMPHREEIEELAYRELLASMSDSGTSDPELARRWGRQFTPELTGLTRTAATHVIHDANALKPGDLVGAVQFLAERKRQHLARELSMDILDTCVEELPVGLDNLYRYLDKNRERIRHMGRDRAKGLLLIGPPGTGKTMLAKAAGKILDLPVVEFRISALMNSYLGATERRFDQAFQTLEAMAPNVVFIDEVEKAFSPNGSENDGGTMMRTTGRLLTWLSENTNPNFIIATSNNVSRMGELGLTMTRSGRFDKIFFVDVPSALAREQMLKSWLRGQVAGSDQIAKDIANATEKFTGADLKSVINEAVSEAQYLNQELDMEILLTEVRKKELRVQELYDSFAPLRDFARLHCEPAGRLAPL